MCATHTAILEALLHGSPDDVSEALESHLSRYKPCPPARCIGNRHDAMPCCTPILPQNAVSVNNWIQVIQMFYIFAQKRARLRSRPSRLVIHR